MKQFGGNVLFLDRSDINTDEIIPAKYLTEITKQALKPYLLEDLNLSGFEPKTDIAGKSVIISRENFGCGSSREHAPWALEANGVYTVIATNFARIFRQNMFNCGLLAIELDTKSVDDIFRLFTPSSTQTECRISIGGDSAAKVTLIAGSLSKSYPFRLDGFEKALVENEGWLGYAEKKY
ncbi:3-isopropylmalate dehydratase small subunit [Treponema endosymbiont of Eucomonympha sp.]|uniref:3-isopropylmalate dehydratase small subunit n=1 Tax=Treponema endosymbiont of Eucomonympha sp. TaxID=1580831 RepID=UPI000781FBCD|nr:3-isopropylmalate dehydratase [Treponema endosymbiont of Eucomonympha sp.]